MAVYKNIKGNKRESSESFGDFSITESPTVASGYSLIMSEYDASLGKPVLKALQAGANISIDSSPTDVVIAADLSAIPSLPTGTQGQTLTYDSTPSIMATSQLRHTSVGQTAVGTIDSDNQDFQLLVSANGMYAGGSASVLISSMANEGMSQNKLLLSAPLSASARIETGTPSTQYYTDESSLVIDTEHLYFENSHLEASKSLAIDADKQLVTIDNNRLPRLDNVDRAALGATLSGTDGGYCVYDTDDAVAYVWGGTEWIRMANSQADWNQTDVNAPDYIANKPANIYQAKVTITADQLRNCVSTGIEIIPAYGANTLVQIQTISYKYTYGTSNFALGGDYPTCLAYNGMRISDSFVINTTYSKCGVILPYHNYDGTTSLFNLPVYFGGRGVGTITGTTATGTLTIVVNYIVADFN